MLDHVDVFGSRLRCSNLAGTAALLISDNLNLLGTYEGWTGRLPGAAALLTTNEPLVASPAVRLGRTHHVARLLRRDLLHAHRPESRNSTSPTALIDWPKVCCRPRSMSTPRRKLCVNCRAGSRFCPKCKCFLRPRAHLTLPMPPLRCPAGPPKERDETVNSWTHLCRVDHLNKSIPCAIVLPTK